MRRRLRGAGRSALVYLLASLLAAQPALLALGPRTAAAQPISVIPLPSPLALARLQSAYSVDTIAGREVTLTYHVLNTDPLGVEVGEVLLTTTWPRRRRFARPGPERADAGVRAALDRGRGERQSPA
jgi:hypothetical protein